MTKGIALFGKRVYFETTNPFASAAGEGEAQGTKLFIGGLPFSYSMEAVERNLIKEGFKLLGKLSWSKARDQRGHLTDWRDGRRVVWVEVPAFKHINKLKMGSSLAFINYKEMPMVCHRCKNEGHSVRTAQKKRYVLCAESRDIGRGTPCARVLPGQDMA